MKISHPSVYIRMPKNPTDGFIEIAARDLKYGGNRAQVVSDSAIIRAMTEGRNMAVEELVKAKKDPEQYPQLMVRIGGYSGQFVSLSEELQEEIINRHRHCG